MHINDGGLFEPSAAVGDPPAEHNQRQSEGEAPKDGQREVKQKTESEEEQPEDFSLHINSFVLHAATYTEGTFSRRTRGPYRTERILFNDGSIQRIRKCCC